MGNQNPLLLMMPNYCKKEKEFWLMIILRKKKEVKETLHYGRKAKKMNLNGIVHGAKVDQDGILNVQQWLAIILNVLLISILVVKILNSRIILMKSHNQKHIIKRTNGSTISYILDISILMVSRCRNLLKTLFRSRHY